MPVIDQVQKYLDDIYPAMSTDVGIAVRLGLNVSLDVQPALIWLIAHHRAIAVEPVQVVSGVTVPGVVQYQSTKNVRSTSRGFNGSMDT